MPWNVNVNRVKEAGWPSVNDGSVLAVICNWVEDNEPRIRHAHTLAVGWEVWAQVELAMYINETLQGLYASRSAAVYQANASADIVVQSDPNNISPVHVIELKTRGPNDSDAKFRANLEDDRFKLTQNNLRGVYAKARKWMIGIDVTDGTQRTDMPGKWNRVAVGQFTEIFYRSAV